MKRTIGQSMTKKNNRSTYARNGIILSCKYIRWRIYSTHSRCSDLHTRVDRNGDIQRAPKERKERERKRDREGGRRIV